MLTRKQEDYLETISEIEKKTGYARVKDIADNLNVSAASVTSMIQTLHKQEMINYVKNAPITLTEEGKKIASLVKNKHKTFTSFFELIGIPLHIAKNDSMKIEHNLSPITIKRLKEFVDVYNKEKRK